MNHCRDFGKQFTDNQTLHSLVPEFLEVWKSRPILDNTFGMTFNHSYGIFAVARLLQPDHIIESGVWKGHSSFILRQACPRAEIFSLDIDFSNLAYRDSKIHYISQDFSHIDWSGIDGEKTLCFFDDHVSALQRLLQMKWWDIKHAVFEDNWPAGIGDSYSLRHIFDRAGHESIDPTMVEPLGNLSTPSRVTRVKRLVRKSLFESVLRDLYHHQHLTRRPNEVDAISCKRNIEIYWEVPPVVSYEKNNWLGDWEFPFDRKEALFSIADDDHFRALEEYEPFRAFHYGYMAYVRMKERHN